ncbi:MAG: Glucose-6-phosphate 1-dehydrogenase [Ramalina farinacea]|uniref:glucose-6-phosphate dehydrogenase (NADP(+)) n=1 Tax=Ramalina farinacea TaxID=258253 RepID=A0AA43QQU7_9LECA|nr:Glucose-6-phosphate 1-dehydrogenase [Ramalina farinacea]
MLIYLSFQLYSTWNLLPPTFRVIGFAPDQLSQDEFIHIITGRAKKDSPRFAELLKEFTARCSYVSGHEGGDQSFQALEQRLDELGERKKEQHRLFYLALPPAAFESVSAGIKKFCHSTRGNNRLIIEKPFGHDAQSSKDLQLALNKSWSEDEIFRIDHYLGKEVVNNLLAIRFGNEIFGAIWNKRHIHDIEVF